MANQTAKRDDNRVTGMLGVGSDGDAEVLRVLIDPTTKRLLVDAITENQGYGTVGVDNGTVAAAGTAVQLANHSCKLVRITAHEGNGALTNGGLILVGDSNVVAASATRKGVGIYAGQDLSFRVSNTNLLYIDSVDDNAKVHYIYFN